MVKGSQGYYVIKSFEKPFWLHIICSRDQLSSYKNMFKKYVGGYSEYWFLRNEKQKQQFVWKSQSALRNKRKKDLSIKHSVSL